MSALFPAARGAFRPIFFPDFSGAHRGGPFRKGGQIVWVPENAPGRGKPGKAAGFGPNPEPFWEKWGVLLPKRRWNGAVSLPKKEMGRPE